MRVITVVVTFAFAFAIMILLMALFERSLIFFPTRYPDGMWDADEAARGSGCAIDDHFFRAADGTLSVEAGAIARMRVW